MKLKLNKEKFAKIQSSQRTAKKYTILLVDDEPANLKSIANILSDDYKVLTASDGQNALNLLEDLENPEEIQCIISDQRMPVMSGVEFLEKSIAITPKTIRLILTGYTDIDSILAAINKAQIYKFLTKPVDAFDLKLTLTRAFEAREMEKDLLEKTSRVMDVEKRLEREVSEVFISSLSPEEMHWFVDAVKGMILSGRTLGEKEISYLRTVLTFLSNKDEASRLAQMIKNRNRKTNLPPIQEIDDTKAFDIATVLLKFAMVDGSISKQEAEFFKFACGQMGFNSTLIKKFLIWAQHRLEVDKEHHHLKKLMREFRQIDLDELPDLV